ncbi:MAG: hypothetical protein QOI85_1940 [Chloroflexota bacterium]|jgi:hypothetical protein|nr:hypothetical protein [Chloroflexota bacterium]
MNRIISLTLLVALLTACAATADAPTTDPGSATPDPGVAGRDADGILTIEPGSAGGPGISIEDAVGNGGDQPLLVNGALFVDPQGKVLLCDAIAESFPPQCGGLRLEVRGLDLASLPDLEEENGMRWAEQVQLLGTLTLIEL